MIHMHIGQNIGDGERVGNVGIATLAHLATVALFGVSIGALDPSDFFRLEVGGEFIREYI
jgi:hypothetical protein